MSQGFASERNPIGEPGLSRPRPPIAGDYSDDPHDGWAPLILPTQRFYESKGPRETDYLQMGADSLGYPYSMHWIQCLDMANALSVGIGRLEAVAKRARIRESTIPERMQDLRILLGRLPVAALVDRLFQEQFLSFRQSPARVQLSQKAMAALRAAVSGKKEIQRESSTALYAELDSLPTMPAAIRKAYEHGVRTPLGLPEARLVGFHLITSDPPLQYPGQPPIGTYEKKAWNVTKQALEGRIPPVPNRLLPINLNFRSLAVASLTAIGRDYTTISEQLGISVTQTKASFRHIARTIREYNAGILPPKALQYDTIHALFESDTFFATRLAPTMTGAYGRRDAP